MSELEVRRFVRGVAAAVVATGAVTDQNLDAALALIKGECLAFLIGDEYRLEREAVLAGTISELTVRASIAASCALKITGKTDA